MTELTPAEQRTELLKIIEDFRDRLINIEAMTDEGFVLGYKDHALFLADDTTVYVMGVEKARIFEVADPEIHLTNGHGEEAIWMSLIEAKGCAKRNLIDVIKNLEDAPVFH